MARRKSGKAEWCDIQGVASGHPCLSAPCVTSSAIAIESHILPNDAAPMDNEYFTWDDFVESFGREMRIAGEIYDKR